MNLRTLQKIVKKGVLRLPRGLRDKIIRTQFRFDETYFSSPITVKLAKTKEEYEMAFRLLHDAYVEDGLMDPDPSGLRINIFFALPTTSTLIAVIDNRVVGTISLIVDSPFGLPSDSEFMTANVMLREKGKKIVEVSALAVDRNLRSSKSMISVHLMKSMALFSSQYLCCEILQCVVRDRVAYYYEALFGFSRGAPAKSYQFVKGVRGAHLYREMGEEWVRFMTENFSRSPRKNPGLEYSRPEPRYTFPQKFLGQTTYPNMTPGMLEYFFVQKSQAFAKATLRQLTHLEALYQSLYDQERVSVFSQVQAFKVDPDRKPSPRLNVNLSGKIQIASEVIDVQIFDVSTDGLYFSSGESIHIGSGCTAEFELDGHYHQVKGKIVRFSEIGKRHPRGFGVKFDTPVISVARVLRLLFKRQAS